MFVEEKDVMFSSGFRDLQAPRVNIVRPFETEENRIKYFSTFHHKPTVPDRSVRLPRYCADTARHQSMNLTTNLSFPAIDSPDGLIYAASSL